MEENLSEANCFSFLRLAEIYSPEFDDLVDEANTYICRHFKSVWRNPEFRTKSKDSIVQLLNKGDLNTGGDEYEVFLAVKHWLEHDQERTKYTEELVKAVRFKTITQDKLYDIAEEEIIDHHKEARALVRSALLHHSKIYDKPLVTDTQSQPRGRKGYFLIYPGSPVDFPNGNRWENETENETYIISLQSEKTIKSKMEETFIWRSMSTVQVNNYLYLFATDNYTYQPVAMRYDASNGQWLTLAPVPRMPTVLSAALRIDDAIYLLSGMYIDQKAGLTVKSYLIAKDVFKYSIRTNEWTCVKDVPRPMFGSNVTGCHINSCIYQSGGLDKDKSAVSHVYAFNTKANLWVAKPSLNHARCFHMMEAIGQHIFVLGGRPESRNPMNPIVGTIEVHNIITEQWTDIDGPKVERVWGFSLVQDDCIVLLGGELAHADPYNYLATSAITTFNTKTGTITNTGHLPRRCDALVGGLFVLPQFL